MNINPLQATLTSGVADAQNSPEGPGSQQAVKNRDLNRAIQAINSKEVFGPGNEMRFSTDQGTGRSVIQIVDRATNEVLNQLPPEEVIRLSQVLSQLNGRVRIA